MVLNSQGLCPACQILDITTLLQLPLPFPNYLITHYTTFTLVHLPFFPFALCTLYITVSCTLYTVYFTHVHCIQYTLHSILYTVYCILCIIVYLYTSFDLLPRAWVPGGLSRVAWAASPGLLGGSLGGVSGPKSAGRSLPNPLGFRIEI